jgi:hypothetical protein
MDCSSWEGRRQKEGRGTVREKERCGQKGTENADPDEVHHLERGQVPAIGEVKQLEVEPQRLWRRLVADHEDEVQVALEVQLPLERVELLEDAFQEHRGVGAPGVLLQLVAGEQAVAVLVEIKVVFWMGQKEMQGGGISKGDLRAEERSRGNRRPCGN